MISASRGGISGLSRIGAAGARFRIASKTTPEVSPRSRAAMGSKDRRALLNPEFTNATADPVFDGTLRDVVITELERSPSVEVVEDDRVSELLKSLGQPADTRFTPDLAQKVCERGGGKLVAEGAIKPQGGTYGIELTTRDCASGRVLS